MPASVILIGLPGVGKTTLGKELAKNLDFKFLDTDFMIEELEGYSISEIFEQKGEEYFRALEASLIKSLSGVKNKVISIGGGAFQTEVNRNNLMNIGRVVYLYAAPEVIWERIKGFSGRPLLKCDNPYGKLVELHNARHSFYEMADYKIDTNNLTKSQVIEELLKVIDAKNS